MIKKDILLEARTRVNQEHLALTEGKTLAKTSGLIILTPEGQQETKFALPED